MDQVVSVGVLAIAAIVGAVLIITTIAPSVSNFNDATASSNVVEVGLISNRLEILKVEPINDVCAYVWAKNTGNQLLEYIEHWDVFVKRADQTIDSQVPYISTERSLSECRFDQILPTENPCTDCWSQTPGTFNLAPQRTTKLHLQLNANPFTPGDYTLVVTTPEGITGTKGFRR